MKRLVLFVLLFVTYMSHSQTLIPEDYKKAMRYGAKAMITVSVKDIYKNPVTNAEVRMFFRQSSVRAPGKTIIRKSNNEGIASAQGKTTDIIFVSVSKPGYYNSRTEHYAATRDPKHLKDNRWLPWNPTVEVILKPIVNPVNMKINNDLIKIDKGISEIGFDMIKFDLVTPHGKGVVSDMVVHSEIIATNPILKKYSIEFPGEKNGIYLCKKDDYSHFKSSYHALTNVVYNSKYSSDNNCLLRKDEYFVFRIRSKIKDGKLTSAQYGKIYGAFEFWESDMRIKMMLNPIENDTNLEFDGTGFRDDGPLWGR